MKSGKHEVTGQRGLNAHLGGFPVPHLTDHDHIRVSAEKCPHGSGKVIADFGFDLHLPQALLRDFHRILCGPDLSVHFVYVRQGGMKCGGFTGPRGATAKNQTIWHGDRIDKVFIVSIRKPHLIQGDWLAGGQNPHDHIL